MDRLAAVLPGSFGATSVAVFAAAATMLLLLVIVKRSDQMTGGPVERTRRWRLTVGFALLGAAAVVGIVGYMKISLETLVPVQVVYLASAGFAVLVLAVAGGSMLVAEQLRADERRLREIEGALVAIAGHVAPTLQEPPRLRTRDEETAHETTEVPTIAARRRTKA